MPKPILSSNVNQQGRLDLSIKQTSNTRMAMDLLTLEKRLRVKRSNEYMNAIEKLDIGGCEQCKKQFDDCVAVIKDEFKDIPEEHYLVGLLSKCYLGHRYDVHTVDFVGNIVNHYLINQSLPALMERARGLAIHGGYKFIEVYSDILCAVKADGTVNIVK